MVLRALAPRARLQSLEFTAPQVRDRDGAYAREGVHYRDLFAFRDVLEKDSEFCSARIKLREQGLLDAYFEKETVRHNPVSDPNGAFRRLYFIRVVEWHARTKDRGRAVFLVTQRPWHRALAVFASSIGVELLAGCRAPPPLRAWVRHALSLFPLVEDWLDRLRNAGAPDTLSPRSRYRVVAESFGSPEAPAGEGYSDLFFLQGNEGLERRAVLALSATLIRARGAELRARGVEFLNASRRRRWRTGVQVRLPLLRDCVRFLAPRYDERGALAHARWRYRTGKEIWAQALADANARVLLSWYKYDAQHMAATDAMIDLGGVAAVWQRSFDPAPTLETTVGATIVFGFSRRFAEFERRSGSRIGTYVIVGYPADYVLRSAEARAKALRERLVVAGARRILAFFDINASLDSGLGLDSRYFARHYQALVDRVNREPSFGVVVKSKKGVKAAIESHVGGAREAIRSGRLFFCEDLGLSVPPATAALAADASIQCPAISLSAAFESALLGKPTLLMDDIGLPFLNLGALGEGVVYNNWDALWRDLAEHWSRPAATAGFGRWSGLDELDPFQDGLGAQRVGRYLGTILEGFDRGLSREAALANAADEYTAKWGRDKVLNP